MKLRPYQFDALTEVFSRFDVEGETATCVEMATGTGKTVLFSHAAREIVTQDNCRAMSIAHRDELVWQAQSTLGKIAGVECGVEMAGMRVGGGDSCPTLVSASVQSLNSKGRKSGAYRMEKFDPDLFGLLIVDEFHHGPAESYRRVFDHFRQNPRLKILGVSATLDRLDGKSFKGLVDSVAYRYGILEAVTDGWLVPIRQRQINIKGLSFQNVGTIGGDMKAGELGRLMEYERPLHAVAGPTLELEGKSIVYAVRVEHAMRLAEIINRSKPGSAAVIHAKTKYEERREIIKQFRHGKRLQYLVNVGIATEGYDLPEVRNIVMARPTKSRAFYTQCIGRGTRTLTGLLGPWAHDRPAEDRRQAIAQSAKPHMTVLDFTDNSNRHKLISSVDIFAGDQPDPVIERARKIIEIGEPVDPVVVLEEAKKRHERIEKARADEESQREKRRLLKAAVEYSAEEVDPFAVADVKPRKPSQWSNESPLSKAQLEMLRRNGVDVRRIPNSNLRQLIGVIVKRRKNGYCTLKQACILKQYGHDTKKMPYGQASRLIDELKSRGWPKPEALVA